MSETELLPAIESAILTELNRQFGPIRILDQNHFPAIINAVLLKFYGRSIDTKLLSRMVAERLCIMQP